MSITINREREMREIIRNAKKEGTEEGRIVARCLQSWLDEDAKHWEKRWQQAKSAIAILDQAVNIV